MSFATELFSVKKFFTVLQGEPFSIKRLIKVIKSWFFIDINVLLLLGFFFLFKCLAPGKNEAHCILKEESINNNIFEFDISKNIAHGGHQPDGNIYNDIGQSTSWVDTGFITTGENLIVYATGSYFPWGKKLTQKSTSYHPIIEKTSDGSFVSSLELKDDYEECRLNTDITYSIYDNEEVRLLYENHLNKYTEVNPSNRISTISSVLYNTGYDITGATKTQADCIQNNNCLTDDEEHQNPIGCVLKNGAGIYMKIGENSNFAYHIINHQVPKLKQVCQSANNCTYEYYRNGDKIETTTIPFGLPLIVYNKTQKNKFIRDTQEDNTKILPITSYTEETNYEFTTLKHTKKEDCDNEENKILTQLINGECYKSVVSRMTPDELQSYTCPPDDSEINFSHPNELCAPQKGKKIYIKTADTFYEDDEGLVKIIFTSGAKNEKPEFQTKMSENGLQLSWIQYLTYKLVAPFLGDQTDEEDISSIITTTPQADKIVLKHTKNGRLYVSTYNGNYIIKTSKYGNSGKLIKTQQLNSNTGKYEYVNSNKTLFEPILSADHTSVDIKPKDLSITPISLISTETTNSIVSYLIKIDNLDQGFFIKIRNQILNNNIFTIIKIFLIIWFVFSFGCGIINKTKIIQLPVFTKDWKNLLILLWATDAKNYALIDEILWPALFHGAEAFSTIFFEAGNSIYGSSIHSNSTFEFFDTAIQSMTSKVTWLKVAAFGTNIKYCYLFVFWFPLIGTGIVKFIRTIAGIVFGIVFTTIGIGISIMLMPIYALESMFPNHTGDFKKMLSTLVGDFIHYAFELGFFGFMVGFVYQTYMDAIDIDICWEKVFSIHIWPIPETSWSTWKFTNNNYVDQLFTLSILLLKATIFTITSIISVKFTSFAKIAADLFWQSSSGFGLSAAQKFGNTALNVLDSATSVVGSLAELPVDYLLKGKGAVKKELRNMANKLGDDILTAKYGKEIAQQINEVENKKQRLEQLLTMSQNILTKIGQNDKKTTTKIQEMISKINKYNKMLDKIKFNNYNTDEANKVLNELDKKLDKNLSSFNDKIYKNIYKNVEKQISSKITSLETSLEASSKTTSLEASSKTTPLEYLIKIIIYYKDNKNKFTKETKQEIERTLKNIINIYQKNNQIVNNTSNNIQREPVETKFGINNTSNNIQREPVETKFGIQASDLMMHNNDGLVMNAGNIGMTTTIEGVGGVQVQNTNNNTIGEEKQLNTQQQIATDKLQQDLQEAKIEQIKQATNIMKEQKQLDKMSNELKQENITEKEFQEYQNQLNLDKKNLDNSIEKYKKLKQKDSWEKKKK